eukprot:m.173676 g.173676  ORF g.173676 m.173676 type:complete len:128 (+) comp14587_c0_seq1:1992-2375(+)
MPLPIQIFEVSDVVLKDSESETGARNVRHLCAAAMSKTAGFQDVQGLLDYIMKMVEVSFRVPAQEGGKAYQLVPSTDPAFFAELGAADIMLNDTKIGVIGLVHPEVLGNFNLKLPVAAFELDLEALL